LIATCLDKNDLFLPLYLAWVSAIISNPETLYQFTIISHFCFYFSGRTEEEARKKAAERFGVSEDKVTLRQGTYC